MKCLIVHNFYQKRGGEDAVFEGERDLLAAGGHGVEEFTLHNDALDDQSKLSMFSNMIWNRGIYSRLERRLEDFRADIVHFHNTFPIVSPGALVAAKRSGAAVVMTLHNYRLLCPSANLYRAEAICEDCLGRSIKWPAVSHACYRESRLQSGALATMLAVHGANATFQSSVDKFIALGEHSRSLFVKAGFGADKIAVKPNFIPLPSHPSQQLRRRPFALFVGRLVPEKGVATLLKAWSGPEAPAVDLMVVGGGPLERQVAEAGGRVKFLGKKSRSEVDELMRSASLLLFPSEWYEPFGLVVIEAFANGLPVLAADVGAAKELIDQGCTGFLFPPGDSQSLARAVRYAFESLPALESMGRAAEQAYLLRYTPARNLKLLEGIYQDAIRRAGAPVLSSSESNTLRRSA
jgi:glycosyltransferase involved in cell wall biosynthesis